MPRFKLVIEYAGTRYRGWQIQKNARTVQGEIARAVAEVAGRHGLDLQGAGRTDAGVHALAQVAHLDLLTDLPPAALLARLNAALPADIAIVSLERTARRFHARHDAVARSYVYQIARRKTAFAKPFVWWVRDPLDAGAMRAAAPLFTGMKDFRSFTDDDPEMKSTLVQVERLEIVESRDLVLVRVVGSHFLWRMVRRIVGVLVEAGKGRLGIPDVDGMFGTPSGLPARLTAPASGLFLERVLYPGDRLDARPEPVLWA